MIDITIKKYSDEEKIMFVLRKKENICNLLSIMNFEDEMDFFGINVTRKKLNNEIGYVFNNSDENIILEETKRFISKHDIEKLKSI